MPLQIKLEDNLYMPVAVCDHCGEQIIDAKQGNYEWRVQPPDYDTDGDVFFTHKGCSRAFRLARPVEPGHWCCIELRELTMRLSANLGQSWQDVKTEAQKATEPTV